MELFCENVQYVEFPINVGGLDFPEMDTFYDVVIMYSDVFHPFCCEVFWPVHISVVLIITFGWNGAVDVWQVW